MGVYVTYTYSATTYYLQDNLTWSTSSNTTIDGQGIKIEATDTDYTTYTTTFTTPSTNIDNPQNFHIYFAARTNGGVTYLDDARLTSASTKIFYLEAAAGGDPSISEMNAAWLDTNGTYTSLTNGAAIASLNDHEWDYGDADGLGFSTIYFRDDSGDPDITGVSIEIPQRTNCLEVVHRYYDFYGGIFRFSNAENIELTSTNPASYNRFWYFLTEYARYHGFSAFGDDNYVNYSVSSKNLGKGFQNHGSTTEAIDSTMDLYLYNTTAYNNGTYNYYTYGKMHLRNAISYNAGVKEFYKQLADPGNDIDPDEQYSVWYNPATLDKNWGTAGEEDIPALHASSKESDPLLKSVSNDDVTLSSGSPAINAGVSVGLTTDYAGRTIPWGGAVDIGAYEAVAPGPLNLLTPSCAPGSGTAYDRVKAFYDAYGCTSGTMNDRADCFLTAEGYTSGNLNDRWREFYGTNNIGEAFRSICGE